MKITKILAVNAFEGMENRQIRFCLNSIPWSAQARSCSRSSGDFFFMLYTKDGEKLTQRRKDAKTQRGVVGMVYFDSICVFFAPLRELDFPHGWR